MMDFDWRDEGDGFVAHRNIYETPFGEARLTLRLVRGGDSDGDLWSCSVSLFDPLLERYGAIDAPVELWGRESVFGLENAKRRCQSAAEGMQALGCRDPEISTLYGRILVPYLSDFLDSHYGSDAEWELIDIDGGDFVARVSVREVDTGESYDAMWQLDTLNGCVFVGGATTDCLYGRR